MSSTISWPQWTNPAIVLYHGTLASSATAIVGGGVDISRGNPNTDFGRGFYTTTLLSQAEEWAETVGVSEGKPHAIVMLTLDRLALRSLRTLGFVRGALDATDYWSFVAHCRGKHQNSPRTHQHYDVVYGPVARSWRGRGNSEVFPDYDQISFHSSAAQKILCDANDCKVEVMK